MTSFRLGPLTIDATAYGSQGNAILGIRDSGKTYTATLLAERLFEANIPFITFDPVGVWRFLRVPGKGHGYPVVVAGGVDGDLPLTVHGAPEIVRAAMRNGVSLVIDLFDIHLSKADWRRIVTACVRVLLHENHQHGLRHVFIEEAAEFVPQRVYDGEVYAEVEKLARMGGNSRLGYTLINQRAQEISKAVLELCENLFLHRQRGKNALESLTKWLDVADVKTTRDIIKSLFALPTGECWAWMSDAEPHHIKVPVKNSAHPDRRVLRGSVEESGRKPVDVGRFVAAMKDALVEVETEAKANDPKLLRMEIARLKAELAKGGSNPEEIAAAAMRGYDDGVKAALSEVREAQRNMLALAEPLLRAIEAGAASIEVLAGKRPVARPPLKIAERFYREKPKERSTHDDLPRPQRRIIDALGFLREHGYEAPQRNEVAVVAGYAPSSGGFANLLSTLHSNELIGYPHPGCIALTDHGRKHLNGTLTIEEAKAMVAKVLSNPALRVVEAAKGRGQIARDELAERANYSAESGGFANLLSRLRTSAIIDAPRRDRPGIVELSELGRLIFE